MLQKITDIIATGAGGTIPVISISTGNQSLNLAASTNQPLNLVASTINTQISTVLTTNDHDKSVENEQRKVVNSETISTSIRLWLIFDTYSKHPTRLLSMTEAFGEKAIMNLRFMFPDDHIPTDDTGFREFLNRNFLRTINLFSDIRNATAKVAMKSIVIAPLTLESLYAYLSAYCTALVPFSDDLLTQASDMDCQKTLIKAFSDELPKVFRNILEETSCSTWSSLQKRFLGCLTPTNVQLAMAREKEWKIRQVTKDNTTQGESSKDASYGSREGKRAASVKSEIASTKPTRKIKSETKS